VTPRSSSCSDSRRWRRLTSRRWCPRIPRRWAEDRQYIRSDVAEAGRAFRRRREECLAHLRGLSDAQWSRAGLHPTYSRMTVEDVVNLMVWHDANHLDQLHRAMRGEA
jgi:DinB superfamily